MPRPRHVRLATALLTGAVGLQAQQTPSFRSQVEAVEVDAFVVDRNGRPVTDLLATEFEILEDGRPQALSSFSRVDIPIARPDPYSPTVPEPDVATNQHGDGRLYAIVFDELCAIARCEDEAAMALRARHFLHQFIEEHFQPNDLGIVVSVGRARSGDMQDFTNSRRLLLKAIDAYNGGFATTQEPVAAVGLGPPVDTTVLERRLLARSEARALRDLMESLARIEGRRKTLLYITHNVGENSNSPETLGGADVFDVLDYRGGVRSIQFDDLRAAMTAAMRGGVAIYAIDPAWLDPASSGADELGRVQSLRALSSATGGFAVVNTNGFAQAFDRIVQENSTYYLLGYTSTNDKRDGRYRRLQVRVTRPGLTVRHRDGYIGPSKRVAPAPQERPVGALSEGVRQSLGSPIINSAVSMAAFATAFRAGNTADANVVVSATLDPADLALTDRSGTKTGDVELAWVAVTQGGKIAQGQHEVVNLALKADTYRQALTNGLRIVSTGQLRPGTYQLRISAGNTAQTRAGSVLYDLQIPDFSKGALAMSAPALITAAAEPLTARGRSVPGVVTIAPATRREFDASEPLSVYVEVYDNGRKKDARTIDVTVSIRDSNGAVRSTSTQHRASIGGTQAFTLPVPLDVSPGTYVVGVTASVAALDTSISRDIPIRIR